MNAMQCSLPLGKFHIPVNDACCLLPMDHGNQVQNPPQEQIRPSRGALPRPRLPHLLPLPGVPRTQGQRPRPSSR